MALRLPRMIEMMRYEDDKSFYEVYLSIRRTYPPQNPATTTGSRNFSLDKSGRDRAVILLPHLIVQSPNSRKVHQTIQTA